MIRRRLLVVIWFSLCVAVLGSNAFAALPASHVTLAWNPSPSTSVGGYRLYQGAATQTYTNVIDVGDLTSVTVSNLTAGTTYFFAVTAYDLIGLESTFSDEINYTVAESALLRISASAAQGVLLTGTAPGGYQYDVLRTADLKTWVRLGSITANTTGSFQFTDSVGPSLAPRYYRLRQTSP